MDGRITVQGDEGQTCGVGCWEGKRGEGVETDAQNVH